MSYHSSRRKKRRLQRGEKLVLKYGIPAAIIMAILIQITVRGVPAFFDRMIDFMEKESWKSRQMMAGYAAEKAKQSQFRTEKKFQTNSAYEIGSTYGSNPTTATKEELIRDFDKYKKNQTDTDDPVYREIKRRELEEEIKEYQKTFKEEE
ncbi:hypothetical protein KJ762_09095 [bacterium]|nr:hypothetical protein [bacterium]MBU1634649.1 hypothetical protein [bacterium]